MQINNYFKDAKGEEFIDLVEDDKFKHGDSEMTHVRTTCCNAKVHYDHLECIMVCSECGRDVDFNGDTDEEIISADDFNRKRIEELTSKALLKLPTQEVVELEDKNLEKELIAEAKKANAKAVAGMKNTEEVNEEPEFLHYERR